MKRLVALGLFALSAPASAQELNLATATAARPNVVLARTGLDHALVFELGYRRVVTLGGRRFFFGGDLTIPTAGADLGDYRLRASAAAPLLESGRWKLGGAINPTLRSSRNPAGTDRALGVDLRLVGGYYARWWLAGEVGVDWAATTHITHSDAYRAVYPGAKDGWYGNPGGTVYAGLHAGVTLGAVDLVLRAGAPRSLTLEGQVIPFYATVGVNVALR